jgi:SAM-dependent methyltransferase
MQAMTFDTWDDGDRYEPYVGRWSRLVAAEFLDWLEASPGGRWLDVGCGTGALSETILVRAAPAEVRGIDASQEFAKFANARVVDDRFEAQVADATTIPFEDAAFDATVSGLVLNFVSDQGGLIKELRRVTVPGGTIGAYVWDYSGGMQMLRYFWDAAADLDPRAREHDEGERFQEIASMKGLGTLFEVATLDDIRTRAIDVSTIFRDFDDYWTPFLSEQGPAPGYCMSLEDAARAELRELLRMRLPSEADGTIRLSARAWAVRGTVPAAVIPETS